MTDPVPAATPTTSPPVPAGGPGWPPGPPPGPLPGLAGHAPDQRPGQAHGRPPAPRVTLVDVLMLVLAVVSVALLSWVTFWEVDATTTRRVVLIDYVVCAIFFVEFCARWRRSGQGWRFVRRYWYEVVGMIPLTHPVFRSFRLLRIVVLLARLARVVDRVFGDRAAAYVVGRFSDTIVSVIRKPVTVAVLDEVIAVIQTGNYTRHVAAAIEENRAELDGLILDLIKQDQTTGKLRYLPFHDDVVRLVADTVLRIADGALVDPRVHELISDAIRESATELRANVRAQLHTQVKRDTTRFGA